jgi:hypothetical protein
MGAIRAVEDESVLNGGYHCPAWMVKWRRVVEVIEDINLSRV